MTYKRTKNILSVGTNAKTIKGDLASEYLTAILYLAPAKENTKGINLCPSASKGCLNACLYTAGRGKFSNVQQARIDKADWFIDDRKSFLAQLHKEILKHSHTARLAGKKPAVRLNGTSDILWGKQIDMSLYPEVQFYDYTKFNPGRRRDLLTDNYHVTFSRAEDTSDATVTEVINLGYNVAVVFDSKKLPKEYLGIPVFNGDTTDLRFLDPDKHIIGLSAKGDAKGDTSGFVVRKVTVGDIL